MNVQPFDAGKHDALPLVADAREGIASLDAALGEYRAPVAWEGSIPHWRAEWRESAEAATAPGNRALPTDAQVIGAVQRGAPPGAVVVCAAGRLAG